MDIFGEQSIEFRKLTQPTDDEIEAAKYLVKDATLYHACKQGRSEDVNQKEGFSKFFKYSGKLQVDLDQLTTRFQVTKAGSVFSGHGVSFGVLGSLTADDPERLIGLHYKYPGCFSSSVSRAVAESFIETSRNLAWLPVLLELQLSSGFKSAAPIYEITGHECEVLIGRNVKFEIIKSDFTDISDHRALLLTLSPSE